MKLESIIFKTGDLIGHLAAAGLFIDAVYNISQGHNYKLAVAEGIASIGIEGLKYIHKRKQSIKEFSDKVNKVSTTQELTEEEIIKRAMEKGYYDYEAMSSLSREEIAKRLIEARKDMNNHVLIWKEGGAMLHRRVV